MIYLFGSLSNPNIITLTKRLRDEGLTVFSEWHSSGPEADMHWKNYFKELGYSYKEALNSDFVNTAFNFDLDHMKQADIGVLVMPAGRSGHLEIGWMLGQGKKGYILFPDGEPERPDLMAKLATDVFFSTEELINVLNMQRDRQNRGAEPPANQFRQISNTNPGLHFNHPRLGISCACADCERSLGNP